MTGLKTASQRVGTAYFQFDAVGDETSDSAFLDLDDFDRIESIVRRHIPGFDYVGSDAPTTTSWQALASALHAEVDNQTAEDLAKWLEARIAEEKIVYLQGVR